MPVDLCSRRVISPPQRLSATRMVGHRDEDSDLPLDQVINYVHRGVFPQAAPEVRPSSTKPQPSTQPVRRASRVLLARNSRRLNVASSPPHSFPSTQPITQAAVRGTLPERRRKRSGRSCRRRIDRFRPGVPRPSVGEQKRRCRSADPCLAARDVLDSAARPGSSRVRARAASGPGYMTAVMVEM